MNESNSQDMEEVLTRRLIKQVDELDRAKIAESGDTSTDGGGELVEKNSNLTTTNEHATSNSNTNNTEVESVAQIEALAVTTPALTGFAKVEKSLISLGFFTP